MSSYRFYSHDPLGRLVDRRERQCRNDGDALALAQDFNQNHDIEVWLGTRHVARIPKRVNGTAAAASPANEDTVPAATPENVDQLRNAEAGVTLVNRSRRKRRRSCRRLKIWCA